MAAERRQHPRIQGPFDATCQGASCHCDARVVDISLGGCFVDVMLQPHVGDRIWVEVRIHGRAERLLGQVVYLDRVQGFAMKFVDNDEQALTALQDMLAGLERPTSH